LLCVLRGLASFVAYASGFRALSDDDYARISIAQRFAESASFDPSHSSWLPAPFWLYGAAFRIFGTSLGVARVTAIALSAGATLLVYVAARLLGASRPGALLSATLATILPYSALLGIAAVPEVPCAALMLLGAATLAASDPRARVLGGVALALACLSRYEAWPVAAIFAGFSVCDTRRNPKLAVAALVALLGPVVWLWVGKVEHGHALFFVARVANYRRALGAASNSSLVERLLEYPGLLLRAEPELFAFLLVVTLATRRLVDREQLVAYRRVGLPLLGLLAFMMFGSARGDVPTHHAARVLLPIWFFTCVVSGTALAHLATRGPPRARAAGLALPALAVVIGLLARPKLSAPEGFAERTLELAAGAEAKRRGATQLAIDTVDYGYFAVEAGFGAPSASSVLDDHDPRRPRPSDPFASSDALSTALREHGAGFLIATRAHAVVAGGVCAELWQNPSFALLQCASQPPVAP
jgi:4-amino-4-deoxy-L-arabinose transferase-like glycosyltransferase